MKKEKLKTLSQKELAESWGIDYNIYKSKAKLIKAIKKHCKENKISQRSLAKLVPGLTQDRVSKIFNEKIGHMTTDKLFEILNALDIAFNIVLKKVS